MKGLNLIKVLELKKNKKYILIIPAAAGLKAQDLAEMENTFIKLCILVKTTRRIKVIEYEENKMSKM